MSISATITFVSGMAHIPQARWDALDGAAEPFVSHAFLSALERSGSVGSVGCGWVPEHLVVRQDDEIVAAMPLYRKFDSFGEFIFDWAWAHACQRAHISYYPKLVGAVPFTPATGTRLLTHPRLTAAQLIPVVADALRARCRTQNLSGAHILFCRAHEAHSFSQAGFAQRHSSQFHWQRDPCWHTFDDFLGALRHSQRKQVRKERARAHSHGLRFSTRPICELDEGELMQLYGFYRHTVWEKGAIAYLTPEMFVELHRSPACGAWVAMAHRADRPVAAALFFRTDKALYGRYWGASEMLDALHFELCYYAPIELCLKEGLNLFEAGAQGEHKLKRGLLPNRCYSVHHLEHPGLMAAVQQATQDEQGELAQWMQQMAAHSPFRRDESVEPRIEPPVT